MKKFDKPTRVWVNSPATTQPFHKLHGKVGIAMDDKYGDTIIHFTTGVLHAQIIDPLYLETANSHTDIFKTAEETKVPEITEGTIIDVLVSKFEEYKKKSGRITDVIFIDGVLAVLESNREALKNTQLHKDEDSINFCLWLLQQDVTTRGLKGACFVDAKGNLLTIEELYSTYKDTQTV